MDFETNFKQFEEIVKKLENKDLSLSQGIELFEEGVALLKKCYSELGEAKGKIEILTQEVDGIVLKPFDLNQNKNV